MMKMQSQKMQCLLGILAWITAHVQFSYLLLLFNFCCCFLLFPDNKSPAKNLRVEFTVDETGNATYKKDEAWGARVVVQYDEENKVDKVNMKIAVYIPGHCVVGEWDLKVRTTLVDSKTDYMFVYPKPVIILFNPWSAGKL